ncbi:hypothetical protein BT69DRAFT_1282941 [Atractiella rhizophila]|nr:hypothetical protein BT69DRAFT_1282941 [Atractiella rhizophila]
MALWVALLSAELKLLFFTLPLLGSKPSSPIAPFPDKSMAPKSPESFKLEPLLGEFESVSEGEEAGGSELENVAPEMMEVELA